MNASKKYLLLKTLLKRNSHSGLPTVRKLSHSSWRFSKKSDDGSDSSNTHEAVVKTDSSHSEFPKEAKKLEKNKANETPINYKLHTKSDTEGPRVVENLWIERRKIDLTAGKQMFLFDTSAAVTMLKESGASPSQAEAIVEVIAQSMHAQIDHNFKSLVTKPQQEIAIQQLMSHIAAVKKDMIILEKSEFSQLKHEYEKQHIELEELKTTLKNELARLEGNVTLDINLEKARSREDHVLNEKRLALLQNKLDIKIAEFQHVIDRIDSRIDKETSKLLVTFERYRNDVYKYMIGTLVSMFTIALGFYRVWM